MAKEEVTLKDKFKKFSYYLNGKMNKVISKRPMTLQEAMKHYKVNNIFGHY